MRFLNPITTSLTILALGTATLFAGSHEAGPHDGAIKARKAQMQLYAFNLGQLGAMARGKAEYNADAASAAAANLVSLSTLNGMAMWPAGSDADNAQNTRALAAIWQNFPDVGAKSQAMKDAANAMADAAGTDLASLQAAMGALGGSCGACHKAYRAEE